MSALEMTRAAGMAVPTALSVDVSSGPAETGVSLHDERP